MSEKRNRSSLTLEAKQFLIAQKEKQPTISIRQLTTDLFLKYNIKTSKSVVFRTLKAKDELKEIRMDNKAIKNRKNMINKGRLEFEKVLDRYLRSKFLKRKDQNLNFKKMVESATRRYMSEKVGANSRIRTHDLMNRKGNHS